MNGIGNWVVGVPGVFLFYLVNGYVFFFIRG